jgi:hypothetical protein
MSLDFQDQGLLAIPSNLNRFKHLGELADRKLAVDHPSEDLSYPSG